jgi:dipeptidyl aminopeptidase/acylaminoacyl peptidase
MRRPFKVSIAFLLMLTSLQAQSTKRSITLDDVAKIRNVGDPQVSPDGKWVAYTLGTVDTEKGKRDTDIWMVSWDGLEQIRLTSTADSSESSPRWSPDNKYLAFLTTRGDESQKKQGAQVWLLNRSGGEGQQLTNIKGGVTDFAWSPDGKRLALVAKDADPDDEPEKKDRIAYVGRVPVAGGPVEKLTDGLRVVSSLSRRDDGSMALLSTTAMEPDEVYAVENSSMRPLTHQNDQLFASLQLGTTENFTSKSKDNTEVHGIMTDYTIATDSRFKAAFSGAGSALQTSMYGLDQYTRQYDNEIGPPWKAQELWMKISYPFFHADRIKTPTLFLGGEKDANVPVAGGEQMYQALRSLGIDTQLVIYPGQYHSLTTPSYQRDRLERYVEWLNKYLK